MTAAKVRMLAGVTWLWCREKRDGEGCVKGEGSPGNETDLF